MSSGPSVSKRNQATIALKRIAPQLRDVNLVHPAFVTNLLNDLLPHAPSETFALASALQNVRFRSAVSVGLQLTDAMRLRQFMVGELGFSELTAAWVADSWLAAFDICSKEVTDHRFKCPNCIQEFYAASYWKNQKLVCPSCNSHVLFSETLLPQLQRKGWAQKRQKGGDWKLVGVSGKLRSTLIREQLQKLLNNSAMPAEAIARELGLEEIVDAIPEEVEKSLARRGKVLGDDQRAAIIRAIVRTYVGDNAFEMQSILRPPAPSTNGTVAAIATFGWVKQCGTSIRLEFTPENIIYAVDTVTMMVSYSRLGNRRVSRGEKQTELRIGSGQSIDFSGSGIAIRKWLGLFVMIGEVFGELENVQ